MSLLFAILRYIHRHVPMIILYDYTADCCGLIGNQDVVRCNVVRPFDEPRIIDSCALDLHLGITLQLRTLSVCGVVSRCSHMHGEDVQKIESALAPAASSQEVGSPSQSGCTAPMSPSVLAWGLNFDNWSQAQDVMISHGTVG